MPWEDPVFASAVGHRLVVSVVLSAALVLAGAWLAPPHSLADVEKADPHGHDPTIIKQG